MPHLLAAALLVPTAVAVLAAPASAAPSDRALCQQLFNTPDSKTQFGDVSEFDSAIHGGQFLGRFGVAGGTTERVRFCLFHDENRNRAWDAEEPVFALQLVGDNRTGSPDQRPEAVRFTVTVTGVPEGDQVCYRTGYLVQGPSGTRKHTDVTRCGVFSAL